MLASMNGWLVRPLCTMTQNGASIPTALRLSLCDATALKSASVLRNGEVEEAAPEQPEDELQQVL
ncbi:MAG: hypothetical protein R2818_13370 [Flavobacteriales bacterium]